ncbi:MAG: hypothetical protein ACL93V_05400 [Candidatus Electrothrix sp. YB6]
MLSNANILFLLSINITAMKKEKFNPDTLLIFLVAGILALMIFRFISGAGFS